MKRLILIFNIIVLTSCASIYVSNLSDSEKFASYVGKRFPLTERALLCKNGLFGDNPKAKPEGNELILTALEQCKYGGFVAKLGAGSMLTVEKIVMYHHIPPLWRHIYFIGSVETSNGETFPFYFFHGFDGETPGKFPW